jgi:thiamine pyridinylase
MTASRFEKCLCGAIGIAMAVGLGACASSQAVATPGPQQVASPTKLRVALFPYIPDANRDNYRRLLKHIEEDFEKTAPVPVDLELRFFRPDTDDFYEPKTLKRWLEQSYDVVEIDTVVMDEVRDSIQPWRGQLPVQNWHDAARAAVAGTADEAMGYPHLLCSHFIVSRDPRIASAGSADAAVTVMAGVEADRKLVADFQGSWNLPALFIDAYGDTHGLDKLPQAIPVGDGQPDGSSLAELKKIERLCRTGAGDLCLEGAYHEASDLAADRFAYEEAAALIGYSERLHRVRRSNDKGPFYVGNAPFGPNPKAAVFVDALVLSRKCEGDCARVARLFADYLNSDSTMRYLLMSEDVEAELLPAVPRYLLPATLSVYEQKALADDPYYPVFRKLLEGAVPFPSSGLYKARTALKKKLVNGLSAP